MNQLYHNFREYLRTNSKGILHKISHEMTYPINDKDKMICLIHRRKLPPELVFNLDDYYSDYWLQKAVGN